MEVLYFEWEIITDPLWKNEASCILYYKPDSHVTLLVVQLFLTSKIPDILLFFPLAQGII